MAEQRHDAAKKALGGLSPRGLLKRGWNGVTSPLNALKDSVVAATTPRSVAATPTNRMTLPSPTEYPSLFDVRGPSSTRSADGAAVFNHKQDMEARMPQSARESSSTRTGSWGSSGRTASSSRGWPEDGAGDAQAEEERAYLSVCHHNLHSVLSNPKANNWGGALLDAFYPTLDVDIALAPFPGLADVSTRDFQLYLRQFGTNAAKYEENHVKPVSEQLTSSNVPSISVADGTSSSCGIG
jgi:hypothetical protein